MEHKEKNIASLTKLINLPLMTQFAVLIGKVLPRKSGLKLASLIGTLIGSGQKRPMVRAIRANQWVIHDQSLSEEELTELPKEVFRSAAKCIFDYFYFLPRAAKLREIVDFGSHIPLAFERIRSNQPTVFVCPHLSNFDLMGYVFALNNLDVQVLSYPNPGSSYKLQNQLRESLGILVTPMNLSAFRQARHRLRSGGSILTGLDRPLDSVSKEKYQPTFFGYPTNLPVFYVRMAIEANAPVIVVAATSQPGGRYTLEATEPIWMEPAEDLDTEIINNANRVLSQAEEIIKQNANQWAMFYPVWPQFLGV